MVRLLYKHIALLGTKQLTVEIPRIRKIASWCHSTMTKRSAVVELCLLVTA